MLYLIIGDSMVKKILIVIVILLLGTIIYNYYYVDNYDFKLNGSKTIMLNIGDVWEDPLYTIKDNKKVNIDDNINYYQEGNYEINYTFKFGLFSKTLTRNITILNKEKNTNLVFSLKGNNPYYLMINKTYIEPGYEVYDSINGLLTNNVQVFNNLDNTKEGTYDINYQVKNSDGITKTVTRNIIVYSLKFEGKLQTEDASQENEIIINITDNNYSHTILPDKTKNANRLIKYSVNENGPYTFLIYDKNNDVLNYNVNITNIDHEKPTGTCVLSLLDKGAKIQVTANDNNQIQGYEYQYGNNKTKLISEKYYDINTMDEKAYVTIYDTANNYETITCNTVDHSTKKTRQYTLETYNYNGTNKKYWLYQPNITVREKVPLVIYFHGDGGSGSTAAVNNIAIPKNLKDGEDFPYYVVAPYVGTQENFVLELINYLIKNYNIDSKRIILSGGSSGSPAALRIASNNPNKFSCIVIISSFRGTPIYDVTKLTYLPIWFFQGSGDMYSTVEEYVNKINNAGGNAKLTQYKGGHDAPVNAFLRTDLTNWLLTNKAKQGF